MNCQPPRIDGLLEACGRKVQHRADADIHAQLGVTRREFPLQGGDEADYLLYADGKAIGVVEAKPEGHTLTGVGSQPDEYVWGPSYRFALTSRTPSHAMQATRIQVRTASVAPQNPAAARVQLVKCSGRVREADGRANSRCCISPLFPRSNRSYHQLQRLFWHRRGGLLDAAF